MNADKVQAYIDQQVQRLADSRVKPIMDSINAELSNKRCNDQKKAALDADSAECDKRITLLQAELGKANQEVNDLAVKLAEATAGAANSGQTSA